MAPAYKMIIGGAGDGAIRSYKNNNGDLIWASKGHTESVLCLVVSELWESIISASNDGTMMAWGIKDGKRKVGSAGTILTLFGFPGFGV